MAGIFSKIVIEWGIDNPERCNWDGEVAIDAGEILRVIPLGKTRILSPFVWQSTTEKTETGGIVLEIEAFKEAEITVSTKQGRFSFNLDELFKSGSKKELDGKVLIRVIGPGEGKVKISPQEVVAGSDCDITMEFIVGEHGIRQGGGVRILTYQRTDWKLGTPEARVIKGNAKVKVTQADVKVDVKDSLIELGPDISFQMLSFTVTLLEGSLLPNDIIEIKLIGGRAQTFTDNFRFVFFVDHDGDGVFGRLPGFSYVKVLPEKAEHLRLLVPSLVKRGEEYPLRVQVMDKYNNYIREYQDFLKITSTDVEEVSRRGQRRMLKSQLRGLHRVKAVGTKGAISGISPPFFVSDRTFKYHIFWGSIHNHSCLGDGYGNLDFIYHYARDVSGLDFCSVSEHAGFLTINKWAEMQRVAEKYNQPGEFVTFLGCEWNPPDIGVELNYYYPDDKGPLLPSPLLRYLSYRNMDYVPDVERTLKDKNVENAWAELKKRGGIVVLHCSGRRKAKEVNLNILKKYRNCVTLMEIYSEWGASEYFNNPRSPSKEFAAERDDCLHFQRALALGLRTGVIGDGDDHVGMPGSLNTLPHRISPNIWKNALMHPAGLAAVYARELSREGIFDALRNRRCYGTSGSRIFLDFRLGNHLMGEEINIEKEKELWSKRELWVKVGGTAPIEKISIIRNGKEIYYLKGMGDTAEFKYIDRDKASEVVKLSPLYESSLIYYYLRVVQVDGEMAWSSPIWLSWKEGCGAIK
ncbi:DUF3604 domain-containing protein [Candidatus Calescamantes bacterium]|nr:DUF3604 domain-containing protein [Candidatus Calescamantes bacterium]